MVLLHAAVGDRRLWDKQMAPLAARYRVVRYDARGFGDSPLPGGPFSVVRDLCALLDDLGIERAALVGNSLGGKTALETALTHPDRVSALVLVASPVGGTEPSAEVETFGEEEDALLEAGRLDEAVELNLRVWLAEGIDPAVRERVGAMQRRAFEVLLAALEEEPEPGPIEWLEDPPAAGRLGQVRAPTLALVGEQDLKEFRVLTDRLAAEIPSARKAVIPGAGHVPGIERPDEFNRIVLEFLGATLG